MIDQSEVLAEKLHHFIDFQVRNPFGIDQKERTRVMKKYLPVGIYGLLIVCAGIFLIVSKNYNADTTRLSVSSFLISAAVLAFLPTLLKYKEDVQVKYHALHAFAMMFTGLGILFFAHTAGGFIAWLSFLLFYYAVSELIFCNWLFNLREKIDLRVLTIRIAIAFVVGFGTVVSLSRPSGTLVLFGALLIIVGLNLVFYHAIMKIDSYEMASKSDLR